MLQSGGMLVELARVGRIEQRVIEDRNLGDAPHGTLETEAFAFPELALPAALGFLGERVEPPRDVFRRLRGRLRVAKDRGRQHAGYRRLLDDLAIVAAVQPVQHIADDARLLDELLQVRAGAMLARG